MEFKAFDSISQYRRDKLVSIRVLILHLGVLLVLAACATGSGRQGTEIVVTGSGPTGQVQGGSNAVFVMKVTNAGPYSASNIKLIDNVGNQLKLLSITCAATGGATCPAAPSVEMVISEIPNGGVLEFSVTVQLDNNATGTVTNSMVATFANEIDPTQDSAAVSAVAFSIVNDVVVSGKGPAGTVVGGSTVVFVMTVTNDGADATGAFNVYDNVGNGLTLSSITCTASSGAVCPATVGVLTAVPSLAAGGVLTFNVTTAVAQNVNGTVTNELVVDVPGNTSQNNFYASATVVTADLAVSGVAPPGPLVMGDSAAFTMTVTNNGPGTAQTITITNTLSSNVAASGPITCVATGGAVCPSPVGPSMTLASMPAGGILTFTVPFTVTSSTGNITDMMSAASATDPHSPRTSTVGVGSTGSDLVVNVTAPPSVDAGGNAVFTAVVENTGPAAVSNVSVSYTLTGPVGSPVSVTCSAPPTVSCPPTLGPNMTIPALGVGRAVTFTITVPAAGEGTITDTVTANAVGNTDTTNNTGSASINAVNSHNGTYQVFAANGLQYTMTVNFDTDNYTITGNGVTIPETFTFVPDTNGDGLGSYVVNGAIRLRPSTNILVGGENFGGGIIPYFAARVFASTVQQLSSTPGPLYDLVIASISTSGTITTSVATARVSGNTISICDESTATISAVAIPQDCPTADLQSYDLTVSGNIYSGTNTVTGGQLPFSSNGFQLALVGASDALVSAGPSTTGSGQVLVIGLPDGASLAGGTTQGPSINPNATPDWVTMMLTSDSYSTVGLTGSSESATLTRTNSSGSAPFSMLQGTLSSGGEIYVMEAYPISIAFGASSGAASGLLEVTVP
jgi:uncharacterized repeat protein (TIGR01451 family)